MGYSENSNINQAAYELLTGVEINEAFHEKDREAVRNIEKMIRHHYTMIDRHDAAAASLGKNDKELNKHDLAKIAHIYAAQTFRNLNNFQGNGYGPISDYHREKEFYDKHTNSATKRANEKSKECGVSTDTENK